MVQITSFCSKKVLFFFVLALFSFPLEGMKCSGNECKNNHQTGILGSSSLNTLQSMLYSCCGETSVHLEGRKELPWENDALGWTGHQKQPASAPALRLQICLGPSATPQPPWLPTDRAHPASSCVLLDSQHSYSPSSQTGWCLLPLPPLSGSVYCGIGSFI